MMAIKNFLLGMIIACMTLACPILSQAASKPAFLTQSSKEPEAQLPDKRELEKLLKTLEDDKARQELIGNIKALIKVQEEKPKGLYNQTLDFLTLQLQNLEQGLEEVEGQINEAPKWWQNFKKQLKTPVKIEWLEVSWKILIILGAAFLAESLMRGLIKRLAARPDWQQKYDGLKPWINLFLPILLFLGVGQGLTMMMLAPGHVARSIVLTYLYARTIIHLINDTATFLWVTKQSKNKKVRDLETILLSSLRRLVNFVVYGGFLYLALKAFKISSALMTLGIKLYIIMMAVLAIRLILKLRFWQKTNYGGGKKDQEDLKFVTFLSQPILGHWAGLAIAFTCIFIATWVMDIPDGTLFVIKATLLTILTILLVRLVDFGLGLFLDHDRVANNNKIRNNAYFSDKIKLYVLWPRRLLKFLIYGIGVFAILEIWGLDAFAFWQTSFGQAVLISFSKIITVIVVAFVVWDVLNWWMIHTSKKPSRPNKARFRTLLPLFRNISLGFLVVITGLTVLSQLGIDITPLLAGVGVLGVAIGFGAQTLVKDIISGIFFIVENAFAVDDIVQIGNLSGVIEALSIRSLRLRDARGNVHTIPFSTVTTVTNFSREFGYAVVDIHISYAEKVDRVIDVLRKVGERFFEEANCREDLIERPEVLGVQDMTESAVIIRMRVRTKPSRQFAVKRELYRFIKNSFDEAGVEVSGSQKSEDKNLLAQAKAEKKPKKKV